MPWKASVWMPTTRPIISGGVFACTSDWFRFMKMPPPMPPMKMTAAVTGYQSERPRAGRMKPADMSEPMNQPPLFFRCGTEAMASELMTMPRPMKVKSRLASSASRPSSSFATWGRSVPKGPIMKMPVTPSRKMSERMPWWFQTKRRPSFVSVSGCWRCSGLRVGGTLRGMRASVPMARMTPWPMKAPPMPHAVMSAPPNPAPTIWEMFMAMLIITIAFRSVSRSTTVGTMALRTGRPTAMVAPTPAASASAITVVIAPARMMRPAASVTATATSWLPSTMERRLMRSASTPAGMVMKSTGMPRAKKTAPDQPGPRPSPPSATASMTSQTKAKRCMACTRAKLRVLIQR